MMRALAADRHVIALATVHQPVEAAVDGLKLDSYYRLAEVGGTNGDAPPYRLSRFQERFRTYWGIEADRIRAVGRAARDWGADAVVVVGLNVLPYLGAVEGARRVWYAADEWLWHHLSLIRPLQPSTWTNARDALVKGMYERVYAPLLDRVWVVTDADRRAMRWVMGTDRLDVVPNGVDAEYFAPRDRPEIERSCAFWGRLDFGPNVQALQWFCRRVWPTVQNVASDARLNIYGFQPTEVVRQLARSEGIELIPDLPDLRDEIARQQLVVLPFVSGGGIKNKLLEAAAMGKAIVCSPRACGGLRLDAAAPIRVARSAAEWVRALTALWSDARTRSALGAAARQWVVERHTWQSAARIAMHGLWPAPVPS
jgi:glycosyltransferase involved in cell wall biosynthesis